MLKRSHQSFYLGNWNLPSEPRPQKQRGLRSADLFPCPLRFRVDPS